MLFNWTPSKQKSIQVKQELRLTPNKKLRSKKKKQKWSAHWKTSKSKLKRKRRFWKKLKNFKDKTFAFFNKKFQQQTLNSNSLKRNGKSTRSQSKKKFLKLNSKSQTNESNTNTRLKRSKNLRVSSSRQSQTLSTRKKSLNLWNRSGMLCLRTSTVTNTQNASQKSSVD